jgi:hypothetical protein
MFRIPPPPPPENRAACDMIWKNTVEQDRLQITIKHGERALHVG